MAADYLHDEQRRWLQQQARSFRWRTQWPTVLLMVAVYGGWFATLYFWQTLGLTVATLLLIWFTTWYMSFQHELIHGHPTRWPRVNQLLGTLPLAVWYPYGLYRDSHLKHHRNDHLTHPEEDPETYYFSARRWQQLTPFQRRWVRVRNTFPGRLLIAPAWDIMQTLRGMWKAVVHREWASIGMWLLHITLLVVLLRWMQAQQFPIGWYLLGVTYPALSLTKVRSFLEHRYAEVPAARSAINEAGLVWRLLFLNLNYHSVHHHLPAVPWFALRQVYQHDKHGWLKNNHQFWVAGYGEWWRRYFLLAVPVEVHPEQQSEIRHEFSRCAANVCDQPAGCRCAVADPLVAACQTRH